MRSAVARSSAALTAATASSIEPLKSRV